MHPDLKVGLALTLLIVGFAAAMCFRHRPIEPEAPSVELARDADLDAEMDLLPVRTYEPQPPETGQVDENSGIDAESGGLISFTDGELQIPEPIGSTEAGAAEVTDTQSQAAASPQSYTVRSGDTLSGIAAKFLGSTQRYEEIFEANRHLLNSPDDLRPGMELTIPPKEGSPPPAVAGEADVSATEQPADANQAEPTPAVASPFTPILPR